MAKWHIQTTGQEKTEEAELRAKHGDEGYDDRVTTATAKAAELAWESEMFFVPQFKVIAMAIRPDLWPKLKEKSGAFWTRLVSKAAGV